MHRARHLLLPPLIFLLTASARAEQLSDTFPFRRPLTFKPAISDAPGENAAFAELFLNGSQKTDLSDLRVTNGDRFIVPHKILEIDNDFLRIAFATPSGGGSTYYLWWGDPKAEKPAKDLDLKRGVLLQLYMSEPSEYRSLRDPQTWSKMLARYDFRGATFVPTLFLGYNPLGDEPHRLFHYTAQFKIDKPLTPDFGFAVLDSGSVTIDGTQLFHDFHSGMRGQVRDPKSLELKPGWHTIEVNQLNTQGNINSGVSLVWKKPGDANYAPLPPTLFAPIARAEPGFLEKPGTAGYTADFSITPAAEAFDPPDNYFQRYTFESNIPASFKPTITWDFGDGQTLTSRGDTTLKKVSHYFLTPGTYTITLKIEQPAGTFTAAARLNVRPRMFQLFPAPPEDLLKQAQPFLKQTNLAKLTGEQAFRGYLFFKHADNGSDKDSTIAWGRAWLESKDSVSDRTLTEETFDLTRLLEDRRDYQAAADMFHLASQKPVNLEARLAMMRLYVVSLCDNLDSSEAALAEAQSWQNKIIRSSDAQLRALQSALLYAAIAKADPKLAQSLAEKIPSSTIAYTDKEIRQGVLARNIENFIRTHEFDVAAKLLNDWDLEFPAAVYEGFTRTLRVKLAAAQSRPLIAARLALQHAKANPNGFYAAELLYRASQNFDQAKEPAQSKAALDLLTQKYPESPYARQDKKPE